MLVEEAEQDWPSESRHVAGLRLHTGHGAREAAFDRQPVARLGSRSVASPGQRAYFSIARLRQSHGPAPSPVVLSACCWREELGYLPEPTYISNDPAWWLERRTPP